MFGLQHYGECWSGPDSCDLYSRHGDSQLCIGKNYTRCDINDESECVGESNANFVYLLLEGESWSLINKWLYSENKYLSYRELWQITMTKALSTPGWRNLKTQLGLPSTIIRLLNGAFRKRPSNRSRFENTVYFCRFHTDRKDFENGAFYDDVTIFMWFSCPVIVVVLNSSGVVWMASVK